MLYTRLRASLISSFQPPLRFRNAICFRNAIEGVACAQISVRHTNAIKISCLPKSCVHLRKFIVLSAVAALVVTLSRCQIGKNGDESEEERARSLARNGREDRR